MHLESGVRNVSYILLTLDLKAPEFEIAAPNYTTRNTRTFINIISEERLSDAEIYVVDSKGNRTDLTFMLSYTGKEYLGEIIFNGFPIGPTTVYARVTDIVDNVSDWKSFSINLLESNALMLSTEIRVGKAVSEQIVSKTNVSIYKHDVQTTHKTQEKYVAISKNFTSIGVEKR